MRRPWLSVISVVKDDAAGLQTTIASMETQDLDGVEFIVVDGSADLDAVKSLLNAGPMDATYVWDEPRGIYPAMNGGLELATGEFTYFANAGDELFAGDVFLRTRELISEFDWAFGPIEIVSSCGSRVFSPVWDYAVEAKSGFSRGYFPAHQGTFARTELLQELGGFDESYGVAGDYAMALKLSQVSEPVVLPYVVATFYEGGISTHAWSQSALEFHRARREILHPRGISRAVELGNTAKHWVSLGIGREVLPRLAGRRP